MKKHTKYQSEKRVVAAQLLLYLLIKTFNDSFRILHFIKKEIEKEEQTNTAIVVAATTTIREKNVSQYVISMSKRII